MRETPSNQETPLEAEKHKRQLEQVSAVIILTQQILTALTQELIVIPGLDYDTHICPLIGTSFMLKSAEGELDSLYMDLIPADEMLKAAQETAASEKKESSKKK